MGCHEASQRCQEGLAGVRFVFCALEEGSRKWHVGLAYCPGNGGNSKLRYFNKSYQQSWRKEAPLELLMGTKATAIHTGYKREVSGHFCCLDGVPFVCVQTLLWSGLVFDWTNHSLREALSAVACERVYVHQENTKAWLIVPDQPLGGQTSSPQGL